MKMPNVACSFKDAFAMQCQDKGQLFHPPPSQQIEHQALPCPEKNDESPSLCMAAERHTRPALHGWNFKPGSVFRTSRSPSRPRLPWSLSCFLMALTFARRSFSSSAGLPDPKQQCAMSEFQQTRSWGTRQTCMQVRKLITFHLPSSLHQMQRGCASFIGLVTRTGHIWIGATLATAACKKPRSSQRKAPRQGFKELGLLASLAVLGHVMSCHFDMQPMSYFQDECPNPQCQVAAHPNILLGRGRDHFIGFALANLLHLIEDAATGLTASQASNPHRKRGEPCWG